MAEDAMTGAVVDRLRVLVGKRGEVPGVTWDHRRTGTGL